MPAKKHASGEKPMKKFVDALDAYQSLHVIATSLIGLIFVLILFVWTFPIQGNAVGKIFVKNTTYSIWVFEFGALSAFLSVMLLPLWSTFVKLFREHRNGNKQRLSIISIAGAGAFVASWLFFIILTTLNSPSVHGSWPQGLNERVGAIYIYIFIVLLPIPLTNLLIYEGINEKIREISSMAKDEKKLFQIANELVRYRELLQNGLLTMGIIASAVPITAATLRALMIIVNDANKLTFTAMSVIAYGLGFSAIQILFYIPSYLLLTKAVSVLKDKLCRINNFADLAENIKRSKDLDEWLHINISLADNLRTGFFTLAPLLTSFIATLLGINI